MARLDAFDALDVFTRAHVYWATDFHALDSDAVNRLLAEADRHGYRAPRNANGSRGRYWHAYLVRQIEAADRHARKTARR